MTELRHRAALLGRVVVGTAFALHGGISLARWDVGGGDAFMAAYTWLSACLELIGGLWLTLGLLLPWVGAFLLAHAVVAALLLPLSGVPPVWAGVVLALGGIAFVLGRHVSDKAVGRRLSAVDSPHDREHVGVEPWSEPPPRRTRSTSSYP